MYLTFKKKPREYRIDVEALNSEIMLVKAIFGKRSLEKV